MGHGKGATPRPIRTGITAVLGVVAMAVSLAACSAAAAQRDVAAAAQQSSPSTSSEPGNVAQQSSSSSTASTVTTTATSATTSTPVATSISASTSTSAITPTSATTTSTPPVRDLLKMGMSGADVTALQTKLSSLGYWNGRADGTYSYVTGQAVIAYQKAAGIAADGLAGPVTRAALTKNILPIPRTTAGNALEVDKEKQLLMIVLGGKLKYVIHVSTGSGASFLEKGDPTPHVAVTPDGTFAIQRAIDGLRTSKLGTLWRPRYFDDNDGIAIHGEGVDVPAYPASHGCVRMSDPAINWIWATNLAPIGRTVLVY